MLFVDEEEEADIFPPLADCAALIGGKIEEEAAAEEEDNKTFNFNLKN
jgi:hypothetical protein